MPKVSLNKIKYKKSDFVRWLAGEMKIKHIRQKEIASWLGVSQYAVSQKMRDCSFSFTDMLMIFQEMETDKETQIKLLTI